MASSRSQLRSQSTETQSDVLSKRQKLTSDDSDENNESSIEENLAPLVEDGVIEVFKKYYDDGGRTLMKLRQVCLTWRNVIDSSPELMRRIDIPIWDPDAFLKLEIAPYVKAIIFKSSLYHNSTAMLLFFKEMGDKIEKVTFNFDSDRVQQFDNQVQLFYHTLEFCTLLKELKIQCYRKRYFEQSMFNSYGSNSIIKSTQLTTLSVNIHGLNESNFPQFKYLLLMLANLKKLALFRNGEVQEDGTQLTVKRTGSLLNMLFEFMKDSPQHLKELRLPKLQLRSSTTNGLVDVELNLIKIVLLAAKQSTNVIYENFLDLNALLTLEDTPEFPLTKNSQLFTKITKGALKICSRMVNLDRIDHCVNLQQLYLHIRPSTIPMMDFKHWMSYKSLVKLDLHGFSSLTSEDDLDIIFFAEQENDPGIPSLKNLSISNDIFQSTNEFSRFSSYFPNLEILSVICVYKLDNNFLRHLTKLEKLVELNLRSLNTLSNAAFGVGVPSTQFQSAMEVHQERKQFPLFKSLTRLSIIGCHQITDNTLLAVSDIMPNLTYLKIENCTGFTEDFVRHISQEKSNWNVDATFPRITARSSRRSYC